jgi:hypothetical protein
MERLVCPSLFWHWLHKYLFLTKKCSANLGTQQTYNAMTRTNPRILKGQNLENEHLKMDVQAAIHQQLVFCEAIAT